MGRFVLGVFTHGVALAIGFALGIYFLPIITAPNSPDAAKLEAQAADATYSAELTRELRGSDFLHWGEGRFDLSATQLVHTGNLSPGPDYRAYLTPSFVEDEAEFEAVKASSAMIGMVDTFGGFILDLPEGIELDDYTTVVIWCERFGEFITAGQYRS